MRKGSSAAYWLAFGHFIHDVFTAFLAPLLPLLIARFGLSLFQASALDVVQRLPSALNPVLGGWIERRAWIRALAVWLPAATATLLSLIGLAESYAMLLIILGFAGLSGAAFHVAAPVFLAEESKGTGRSMGLFMFGGELARTLGPLLVVGAVSWWGVEGLWRLLGVGVGASLVLEWRLPRRMRRPGVQTESVWGTWRKIKAVLWIAGGILLSRAFLVAAVTLFLPTFVMQRGGDWWQGTGALVVVELAGAVGSLLAGTASDRWGVRRSLLVSVVVSPLALIGFLLLGGLPSVLILAVLGASALATTPVLMSFVLVRSRALGASRGVALGSYMMMSFALRALIVLVVGALGDALGLVRTYWLCAVFAMLGFFFVYWGVESKDGSGGEVFS